MKDLRSILAVFLLLAAWACSSHPADTGEPMTLHGPLGERFDANLEHWLLQAPYANPGMLEMYFRRNQPHQGIMTWYGEFSGKYLTSAAMTYAMRPDERLKETVEYVVDCLAEAQDADGYLGVWPDDQKLTGRTPRGTKTWDAWAHYHNMLGLYFWHQVTGSRKALEVLEKAAEKLYGFFYTEGHPLDEAKDGTDAAVGHIFALLYGQTQDPRWLQMVERTFETFASEEGGDYYRSALEDVPFYQMKRKRWECLHAIQTIGEMYRITGEADYRRAFESIWRGIAQYDRHNTGGFSSGESACGNPYDTRSIETCCTIAWMALSIDMLRMTGDPRVADELELSTWNAFLGAQHPSGRLFTYNTPMLGDRKASAHEIVFQAMAGSSELNCCSVNGPRGFGMIGQWGVLAEGDTLTVNYYGASETVRELPGPGRVTLVQTGDYPFDGALRIRVSTERKRPLTLRLRIPFWSEKTRVRFRGEDLPDVKAGSYLLLPGIKDGDVIDLSFDLSIHCWQGDGELSGKTSLYRGPILLACDQRYEADLDSLNRLDPASLTIEPVTQAPDAILPQPYLLVRVSDRAGNGCLLCDFASAGQTGTLYTSWLPTLPVLTPPDLSVSVPQWGQRP